ncbi:MAG: SGNH/GDSL hydrolase family protein [Candidatus Xenobia bacterium]
MEDGFKAGYTRAALGCFNFVLVFVFFNVLILVGFAVLHPPPPPPAPPPLYPPSRVPVPPAPAPRDDAQGRPHPNAERDRESLQWVDLGAYAGIPAAQVDRVLDEAGAFLKQGYQYLAWVGFAPLPYHSETLNVDAPDPEFPVRRSIRTVPAPSSGKPLQVYVFGGSTTFGVYVADGWTYSSYLWDLLQQKAGNRPVELTNFGRPYYYSTQEVALFARLLKTGHRPDVAIFLDGLNDCFIPFWQPSPDVPMFTDRMSEWIQLAQFGRDWLTQYRWLPMVKLAFYLRARLDAARAKPQPTITGPSGEQVLSIYAANVQMAKALANAYGVRPYFFWQPVPFHHYDWANSRRTYPLPPAILGVFADAYAWLHQTVPGAIDLADCIPPHQKVFVDNYHYSPAFNKILAAQIASHVDLPR